MVENIGYHVFVNLPFFLLAKAHNEIDVGDTMLPKRTIIMDPEFANILYEKLKCFFEGQETALYNKLIKNEITKTLVFDGNANQLAELFKRLRYNAQITVSTNKLLAEWLVEGFCTINTRGKISRLVFSTVEGILKNRNREPQKKNRILIEVAQYLLPGNRKIDKN